MRSLIEGEASVLALLAVLGAAGVGVMQIGRPNISWLVYGLCFLVVLLVKVAEAIAWTTATAFRILGRPFNIIGRLIPWPRPEPWRYPSLADKSIRLFYLRRRLPFTGVKGTLTQVPLRDLPEYDAISYTWGTSTEEESISANGTPFHTSKATHDAVLSCSSMRGKEAVGNMLHFRHLNSERRRHRLVKLYEAVQRACQIPMDPILVHMMNGRKHGNPARHGESKPETSMTCPVPRRSPCSAC